MVCPWHNQTPAEVLRDQGRLPLQGNDRSERGESLTNMTGELLDSKCVSGERSESAHHYSPGGSQEGGWQVLLRPGDEQTSVLPVCRHQGPGGGVAGENTNLSVDSSVEWVQGCEHQTPRVYYQDASWIRENKVQQRTIWNGHVQNVYNCICNLHMHR